MKGDPLPASDHVLRHCRTGDPKVEADGSLSGVFPSAFEPDADGISVTWIEFFEGSPVEQLVAARVAMNCGRRLRESNRLAKLNVRAIRGLGKSVGVFHDPIDEPEKENNGHSLITGIGRDDDDLLNRLTKCVSGLELAKI